MKTFPPATRSWLPYAPVVATILLLTACSTHLATPPVPAISSAATVGTAQSAGDLSVPPTPPATLTGPTDSNPTSPTVTNAASNPSAPADLAPDPNGAESRCLLGDKPLNIEFYGIDASNVCVKYATVLAEMGLPNLPIHPNSHGGEIPEGFTVGCYLSYPLNFGNLYAGVNGYVGRAVDAGDAGPLAKSVCTRLLSLGWTQATG